MPISEGTVNSGNLCDTRYFGICKDVFLIGTACGEFRDNSPFRSSLEPVQSVGHQRVLVSGVQDDLMPYGVVLFLADGQASVRTGALLARHVQVYDAPATAKSRFLSGI